MPQAPIQLVDLPFPLSGVHESSGLADQPPGTSPEALNARGYDLVAKRERGCQRVGLLKAVASNQTGEGIDLLCVGYVGKAQWLFFGGAGGTASTSTGASYITNGAFKLHRRQASTVLTAQSVDNINPGALAAGNTPNSFVHPANASPNPGSLGLGAYSYTMGTSVFDANGTVGHNDAARTLTITGMPFDVVTMRQAGEYHFEEAFPYNNSTSMTAAWQINASATITAGHAPDTFAPFQFGTYTVPLHDGRDLLLGIFTRNISRLGTDTSTAVIDNASSTALLFSLLLTANSTAYLLGGSFTADSAAAFGNFGTNCTFSIVLEFGGPFTGHASLTLTPSTGAWALSAGDVSTTGPTSVTSLISGNILLEAYNSGSGSIVLSVNNTAAGTITAHNHTRAYARVTMGYFYAGMINPIPIGTVGLTFPWTFSHLWIFGDENLSRI